jgi:hypothetical protein
MERGQFLHILLKRPPKQSLVLKESLILRCPQAQSQKPA